MSTNEEELRAKIQKLEELLRRIQKRRREIRRERQECNAAPDGFVAKQTYGDRMLVPDEDEREENEIEEALKE
jgi:hypothetical protein